MTAYTLSFHSFYNTFKLITVREKATIAILLKEKKAKKCKITLS